MFRKITDTESDELSDRLVPALLSEQPGSTLQHDDDVVKIAVSISQNQTIKISFTFVLIIHHVTIFHLRDILIKINS